MKLVAIVCLVLITMSPAAMEAFGQITGATILSGTMDLGEGEVSISAVGVKDGLVWDIKSEWKNGYPQWIHFLNPRPSI
jgi:hypothetical protein